jgi:hypothetical protein
MLYSLTTHSVCALATRLPLPFLLGEVSHQTQKHVQTLESKLKTTVQTPVLDQDKNAIPGWTSWYENFGITSLELAL